MRRTLRIAAMIAAGALLGWSANARADGYVTGGTKWWHQSQEEAKYQEFQEVPQGLFIESFLYRNPLLGGHVRAWGSNLLRSDESGMGDQVTFGPNYVQDQSRSASAGNAFPQSLVGRSIVAGTT